MKTSPVLIAICLAVLVACSSPSLSQAPDDISAVRGAQASSAGSSGETSSAPSTGGADHDSGEDGQNIEAQALDVPGFKQPGRYFSTALSIEMRIETGVPFKVSLSAPGYLILESQNSNARGYQAIALIETEILVVADELGNITSRLPVTFDLTAWAANLAHSTLIDQGEGEIAGQPGSWWTISTETDCSSCWYELFSVDGGGWWTATGSTHKIWRVEVDGSSFVIDIEAATEGFEDWERAATRDLLDKIELGPMTKPLAQEHESAGPHQVSRVELTVIDDSRATNEVNLPNELFTSVQVVVPAADSRTLPLSLVYPSTQGGYGGEPDIGPFPLVIVAHSLGGSGQVNDLDRLLASHGYVVARIRFPESSLPGNSYLFVGDQPGDVSFVISELLGEALPASFGPVLRDQAVGVIGYSLGGTTAYGVLGAECCRDFRVDAAIAHAGTYHDFNGPMTLDAIPLLIVGSTADQVLAEVDLLETLQRVGEVGERIVFATGSHLGWLDPASPNYVRSFEATLRFLDTHLKGG